MGLEDEYLKETERLCARIVAEGGYRRHRRAPGVAVGLNAMIDGLWFDCLMSPAKFDRQAAKRTCLAYPRRCVPAPLPARAADQPSDTGRQNVDATLDARHRVGRAGRTHTGPGWQRRCAAAGTGRPAAPRAWPNRRVGEGAGKLAGGPGAEPTSSQIGRLIVAVDPAFVVEVYGNESRRGGIASRPSWRRPATPRRERGLPSISCATECGDAGGDFGATTCSGSRGRIV